MDLPVDATAARKLAIVEVLDRDGHPRLIVPVWQWPVTIGRAIHCDVVLDDVHVAAHHATLSETDGQLSLKVGDSVNGAHWSKTHLKAGEHASLPSGEVVQIGVTRLRVRQTADLIEPERPILPEPSARKRPILGLAAVIVVWTIGTHWLITDPGSRLTDYLEVVLTAVAGLIVWCGVWALGSKLFRHRFEFWPHARIAVRYLIAAELIGVALPVLAYMFGWVALSRGGGLAAAAVTCAMVVAHLTRLLPTRRPALTAVMAALFAAGSAVMMMLNYQAQDRLFPELYVSTLAPPALRLARPVEIAHFIEEAKDLQGVVDAHVSDDDGGEDAFMGMEITRRAPRVP